MANNVLMAEVTNVSEHGLWVFVGEREYFLPFEWFPWCPKATIGQIPRVECLHGCPLYRPPFTVM